MNTSTIECQAHPGEQVLGICMEEKCTFSTRLMCFSCNTEQHSEHARSVIRIQDLESKTLFEHKNWPLNDLAQDIKNYVEQQAIVKQGGEDAIDKLFEEIKQRMLDELEKVKKDVKKQLQKTLSGKDGNEQADQFLEKLKSQTQEIFGLQKVGALFTTLRNSEITANEFNSDLSDFLQNVSNEELLTPLSNSLEVERDKLGLILDTTALKEKSKDIYTMIQNLSVDVVTESSLGFVMKWLPQTNQKDLIQITENGRKAHMPSSYQGIFSSVVFERGRWEFEIYSNSNMSSNCVLFGMIPDENQQTTNNNYSSHPYHCWANGCASHQTNVGGQTLESGYKQGNTLRVYIDMDNNKYEYGWKGAQSKHINNGYVLKGKKMRFYINSFGIGNLEFQLMKSQRSGKSELTYENAKPTESSSSSTAPPPAPLLEEWE